MIGEVTTERDEARSRATPHLSHSRVSRYLHCPEQYRLYYQERLRPRYPSASLVFGRVVHEALALLFRKSDDPAKAFADLWASTKDVALTYGKRESWEALRSSGMGLLDKFVKEELKRLADIRASEQPFELDISSLDLPFVGVVDLFADLDGKPTIVDFKTSGSIYEKHEAVLSDQLTAYHLAEPAAEQMALCVLVRTKEPKIEWHVAKRSSTEILEYLEKAEYVIREIQNRRFYKRPGKWCSWCDYLPVCLGDDRTSEATLVHV